MNKKELLKKLMLQRSDYVKKLESYNKYDRDIKLLQQEFQQAVVKEDMSKINEIKKKRKQKEKLIKAEYLAIKKLVKQIEEGHKEFEKILGLKDVDSRDNIYYNIYAALKFAE